MGNKGRNMYSANFKVLNRRVEKLEKKCEALFEVVAELKQAVQKKDTVSSECLNDLEKAATTLKGIIAKRNNKVSSDL